jgi:hypothetical protein
VATGTMANNNYGIPSKVLFLYIKAFTLKKAHLARMSKAKKNIMLRIVLLENLIMMKILMATKSRTKKMINETVARVVLTT